MQAGRLDRRVSIYRPVTTRAADGQDLVTWELVAEVWASVKADSGRENFEAERRTAEQTAVFTFRHRGGIVPRMELEYAGRRWDIRDVAEGRGRRRELEITATAREVDGGGG